MIKLFLKLIYCVLFIKKHTIKYESNLLTELNTFFRNANIIIKLKKMKTLLFNTNLLNSQIGRFNY